MKYIAKLFMIVFWVAGVVLAKGFWSTAIACIFPLWGWYLVVERAMVMAGIVA